MKLLKLFKFDEGRSLGSLSLCKDFPSKSSIQCFVILIIENIGHSMLFDFSSILKPKL